jgi:hypothetical protein
LLTGLQGRWPDFEAATPSSPEEIVLVKQIVGPLDAEHVPIIRCIGLDYIKHSKPGRQAMYGVPIRRRHGVDLELTKHKHHQNDPASRLHPATL